MSEVLPAGDRRERETHLLSDQINTVSAAVLTEQQDRIAGDAKAAALISDEANARQSAIAQQQAALADEILARQRHDDQIKAELSAEILARSISDSERAADVLALDDRLTTLEGQFDAWMNAQHGRPSRRVLKRILRRLRGFPAARRR